MGLLRNWGWISLIVFSLGLISCNPAHTQPDRTSTVIVSQTPLPTHQPYWGLDPTLPNPLGGWLTYSSEEVKITFDYPAVYEQGEYCGLFITDKVVEHREYHLIGFGSSIRISAIRKWTSEELDFMTKEGGTPPGDLPLLTDVETFSIGGHPAYRYIHQIIQAPNAFEYAKTAWTFHNEKLYLFSYIDIADLARCDATPLSEDEVYEYFLTTVEFLD